MDYPGHRDVNDQLSWYDLAQWFGSPVEMIATAVTLFCVTYVVIQTLS